MTKLYSNTHMWFAAVVQGTNQSGGELKHAAQSGGRCPGALQHLVQGLLDAGDSTEVFDTCGNE